MRGHGFTVVGSSIEECVLRAVYTAENASIQTTSLMLNAAFSKRSLELSDIDYLRPDELGPAAEFTNRSYMRPWSLWLREVESAGLYVNNAKQIFYAKISAWPENRASNRRFACSCQSGNCKG
jgi:hypothetical protein